MLDWCQPLEQMNTLIGSSLANHSTSKETEVTNVNDKVVKKRALLILSHRCLKRNNRIFIMSSVILSINPSALLRSDSGQKWNENGTHFVFPQSAAFPFLNNKYRLLLPAGMEGLSLTQA